MEKQHHSDRQPERSEGLEQNLMQKCIENCLDCFQTCTELIIYCVGKGGKHAEPDHIRLLQSCSFICGNLRKTQ